jgi:hypothetical protein
MRPVEAHSVSAGPAERGREGATIAAFVLADRPGGGVRAAARDDHGARRSPDAARCSRLRHRRHGRIAVNVAAAARRRQGRDRDDASRGAAGP